AASSGPSTSCNQGRTFPWRRSPRAPASRTRASSAITSSASSASRRGSSGCPQGSPNGPQVPPSSRQDRQGAARDSFYFPGSGTGFGQQENPPFPSFIELDRSTRVRPGARRLLVTADGSVKSLDGTAFHPAWRRGLNATAPAWDPAGQDR